MRFSIEDLMAADSDYAGFCINCGTWHDGVEPDARGYTCEECKTPTVFGAMEIVIMGLANF